MNDLFYNFIDESLYNKRKKLKEKSIKITNVGFIHSYHNDRKGQTICFS